MERSARSRALYCPVHKSLDDVRQVSALYAEAASPLLDPQPVLKSADRLAWAGTICGVAGAVLLWVRGAVGGAASGPALVAAIVCFGYAIACYAWASARRARLVRVRRGMPRALDVWRAGWYCERCDGVFFAPGSEPAGAAPGELLSARAFQHLVWSAATSAGPREPAPEPAGRSGLPPRA